MDAIRGFTNDSVLTLREVTPRRCSTYDVLRCDKGTGQKRYRIREQV
jgi:hypothetical protein